MLRPLKHSAGYRGDPLRLHEDGGAGRGRRSGRHLLSQAARPGGALQSRRLVRPAEQKTKGKVERPFRYVREDFFLGRSFRNLDDLNAQLRLDTVANPRRHASTRVVLEHFAEEQPYLKAPPAMPFAVVLTLDRRVTREGMVSVGGNLYSVSDCTRRRIVEVHTLADEIGILEDDKLIAVHPVLKGRGQRRIAGDHRTAPRFARLCPFSESYFDVGISAPIAYLLVSREFQTRSPHLSRSMPAPVSPHIEPRPRRLALTGSVGEIQQNAIRRRSWYAGDVAITGILWRGCTP